MCHAGPGPGEWKGQVCSALWGQRGAASKRRYFIAQFYGVKRRGIVLHARK